MNIDSEERVTKSQIDEMQKIMIDKPNGHVNMKRERESDQLENIEDSEDDESEDDQESEDDVKEILIDDD